MTSTRRDATLLSPQVPKAEEFQSAETAVDRLQLLYDLATDYLAARFPTRSAMAPRSSIIAPIILKSGLPRPAFCKPTVD